MNATVYDWQPPLDTSFSRRLRDIRKRAGITQDEAASRSGLSSAVISKWERDESRPTIDDLCALLTNAYRVPAPDAIAWLIEEWLTARTGGDGMSGYSGTTLRISRGSKEFGRSLYHPVEDGTAVDAGSSHRENVVDLADQRRRHETTNR